MALEGTDKWCHEAHVVLSWFNVVDWLKTVSGNERGHSRYHIRHIELNATNTAHWLNKDVSDVVEHTNNVSLVVSFPRHRQKEACLCVDGRRCRKLFKVLSPLLWLHEPKFIFTHVFICMFPSHWFCVLFCARLRQSNLQTAAFTCNFLCSQPGGVLKPKQCWWIQRLCIFMTGEGTVEKKHGQVLGSGRFSEPVENVWTMHGSTGEMGRGCYKAIYNS